MARLRGKVAIITGAGSGIGATTAQAFAKQGARVVAADIKLKDADGTAGAITADDGEAIAVQFDLGDEESIRHLVATTVATYGAVDSVFNNAAATHLADTYDLPVSDASGDVWDDTMRINLRGTMQMIKHTAPHMIRQGTGSIINASSGAALAGDLGHPAYGASKAAVARLTTYAAAEFGKQGIRCNAIAPGLIVTATTERSYAAGPLRDIMLRHHLTPRLGHPDDIANMAVFLASDESSFVTGQIISVDGGLLSHAPYLADVRELFDTRVQGDRDA